MGIIFVAEEWKHETVRTINRNKSSKNLKLILRYT